MTNYFNPTALSHFAPMFNWLMCRTEISASAKIVYSRLIQYADSKGCAFPLRSTLCKETGISSERSLDRYIQELKEYGLVVVQRVGLGRANRYRFIKHPWMNIEVIEDEVDVAHRAESTKMSVLENCSDSQHMYATDQTSVATPIIKDNLKDKIIYCSISHNENYLVSENMDGGSVRAYQHGGGISHNIDYGFKGCNKLDELR